MSLTTDNLLFYLRYSQEEKELISKYLQFYIDLDKGNKIPDTEKQKHFVRFCRGLEQADTPHEFAYLKYKRIQTYANKPKLKAAISSKIVETKSNKEKTQNFKYNSSQLSRSFRRRKPYEKFTILPSSYDSRSRKKSYKRDKDFDESPATIRARNREMLKEQEKAMKQQASKKLNVRNAMVIHSDPND